MVHIEDAIKRIEEELLNDGILGRGGSEVNSCWETVKGYLIGQ